MSKNPKLSCKNRGTGRACHYNSIRNGKCPNGIDCKWCILAPCTKCNELFCRSCFEEGVCEYCKYNEKMERGCLFCSQTESFSQYDYDMSYKNKNLSVCNICSCFICNSCTHLCRYIESDNFTGCINCLITKSNYFDYFALKIATELKNKPEILIKSILVATNPQI